jgi:hypothetical protein
MLLQPVHIHMVFDNLQDIHHVLVWLVIVTRLAAVFDLNRWGAAANFMILAADCFRDVYNPISLLICTLAARQLAERSARSFPLQ